MAKSKNCGTRSSAQLPSSPATPSFTASPMPAALSSPTPAAAPPPPLPVSQSPSPVTMKEANEETVWSLCRQLPPDLCVFLEVDYEAKYDSITKVQFYRVLLHFDPATKSRLSHRKEVLNDAFKKTTRPRILPFLTPRLPAPMETDHKITADFNPMSRKTTRKMLSDAIKRKAPTVTIPAAARLDGLLLLYQEHVDRGLVIPGQVETVRKPHFLSADAVEGQDMEVIRFALQCHAPHVFVHTIPMTHDVLVNCYLKFILEESVKPGCLVRGFHYSIIC